MSGSRSVASTFTRPADTTAYGSGDLVANSTTAGSVTALTLIIPGLTSGGGAETGPGIIRYVRVRKTNATATNAQFRAHFFSATPLPPTNGDNGAIVPVGAATYLGSADVTMVGLTDGCSGFVTAAIPLTGLTSSTFYCLLEARAAYTPGNAETIGVQVTVERTF